MSKKQKNPSQKEKARRKAQRIHSIYSDDGYYRVTKDRTAVSNGIKCYKLMAK